MAESLTTVVSANCKLGFLFDEVIKSSARISSTRFNSPFANSINEPLEKFVSILLLPLLLLLHDDLMIET